MKKILPILFLTLLLDMIGIGMVIPLIPTLFTDPTSPSFILHGFPQGSWYLLAGIVTALFGLMQFIAAPILGELSDVYGRKKLLTMGVAVLAVSQMLFGMGVHISSLALVLISRAIAGVAGANFSIAQASIADVTEPKDRAKNFGLIGAAFGTGFIVGPVMGGWLAHTFDAATPFWVAGAMGVLNLMFITLFLPETMTERGPKRPFTLLRGIHNIRAAFMDADARPVYLSSFLYMSGFAFYTSFVGILLVSKFAFTESSVGTFFGAAGVWIVITQLFIIRMLARKYSERSILRCTLLMLAVSIAIYPFVPTAPLLYVIIPFLAVPQGLSMSNMSAMISKGVSAEKQGAALGINGSLLALSQGVIPVIAGLATSLISVRVPFMIGSFVILMAWCNLFVFTKRPLHVHST